MTGSDKPIPAWIVKSLLSIIMVAAGGVGGSWITSYRYDNFLTSPSRYVTQIEADKDKNLYLALIQNNAKDVVALKQDISHMRQEARQDILEIKNDIKEILKKLH